jgi:uncharacterized C2H2 Zn-finger protein
MESGYIYLLRPAESLHKNENVYKIGKTVRSNFTRFREYPIGSVLIIQSECKNCHTLETRLLKLFKDEFIRRRDYGNEYFEGDYIEMRNRIITEISNECKNVKINDFIPTDSEDFTEIVGSIQNKKEHSGYKCSHCDKIYKHRQSLFSHRNKCHNLENKIEKIKENEDTLISVNETSNNYKCKCGKDCKHKCNFKEDNKDKSVSSMITNNNIFMKLIDQNIELTKQLLELTKTQ